MTRALIVDDRQDNLYLLRALLQARGWEVEEAADGAAALEQARRVAPDIVVSDLLMPVMDGYTLLRHWQADEALRGIPFVVYTATYTEPQDERLALDLGAAAFAIKPQEPDHLAALLDGVLANRPAAPAAGPPAAPADEGQLRQYSEVLVRKLEKRTAQLEEANRRLEADLAARREAEQALRKSETDLRLAQARANIGSWELDLAQGTITASDEMRRLIGRGETAGPLPLAELAATLYPADRWAVEAGGVWSLREPRAGRQQVRVRHGDGATTWIECRAETEFDAAGTPVRVSGTAQDVTERQFLMERLADSNDQLRALAARMDRLREEESSRLSRELHDELGQALAGLKLDLATLHTRLGAVEPGLAERVRSMQSQIDEMVRTTRDIARRLRPRVLDDLGVLPAIEAQAAEICRRMGARYELVSDVDNEALVEPALATAVFRVVQEALTNIARHAGATRVDIAVQRQSDLLTVEVRDNGKGMADPPAPGRATLGLLGMQERAAAIGGQVTVEGFPGKGTVVTLRVPLPRQMEAV